MNEEEKYKLVISTSVKALQSMCIIAIFTLIIIIYINKLYNMNKVWNISFLISTYSIYFASVIQNIICFWKISSNTSGKSNLFFSSCVTFLVFLFTFFMYILMSLILFN